MKVAASNLRVIFVFKDRLCTMNINRNLRLYFTYNKVEVFSDLYLYFSYAKENAL